MAGQYDRNRDGEGRFTGGPRRGSQWQEGDNWERENYGRGNYDRENYGRGAEPPRDDRGRFLSEGENGDYYGGRNYGERDYGNMRGGRDSYGYEESNYARGVGGMFGRGDYGRNEQSGGRERDEYGRFSGDDDHRGGRGNDYDDRGSRGRDYGRGSGWYGDPQGHAQAARERWHESRGPRYEDDDRGARGGPFRGSGGGRERDESGRFMSDDDRGGRGASFRGGGRERDESGRFASDDERAGRGRNQGGNRERDDSGRFMSSDDDDRGARGSQGGGEDHRGWFGDPRGHSQAARLGWRHRQR